MVRFLEVPLVITLSSSRTNITSHISLILFVMFQLESIITTLIVFQIDTRSSDCPKILFQSPNCSLNKFLYSSYLFLLGMVSMR